MCPEYSRFYTECEHTTEILDVANSPDLANTQEVVHGCCPDCPDCPEGTDPPSSLMESGIEPLSTAPIVSYVRSLRGKAHRLVRSLRSTTSDDLKNRDEYGSAQTVSSTNLEQEMAGKENISGRHTKVIVTGGMSCPAAKQSADDQDTIEPTKEAEAVKTDIANAKLLAFTARITCSFATMREKIDTANQRIADIDNFKLAEFMCQGVDRWTAAVKEAIQECEDDVIRECIELAETSSAASAA